MRKYYVQIFDPHRKVLWKVGETFLLRSAKKRAKHEINQVPDHLLVIGCILTKKQLIMKIMRKRYWGEVDGIDRYSIVHHPRYYPKRFRRMK